MHYLRQSHDARAAIGLERENEAIFELACFLKFGARKSWQKRERLESVSQIQIDCEKLWRVTLNQFIA